MYSAVSILTIVSSYAGFWVLNRILDDKSMPVKVPERYSGYTKCKWRNVMGSMSHAILVSLIGFYIFAYDTPEYMTERVKTHTTLGEINIAITVGYLAYDVVDLIRFQGLKSTWPILMHHFTLHFLGFGQVLYHRQLGAYALFGSIIEFNSVFLHGRQLLLMYGYSKASFGYKLNNVVNIVTYIIFRLVGGSVMLFYCLPSDYPKMTTFWFFAFFVSFVVLIIINVILFHRLLMSDFFSKRRSSSGVDQSDILYGSKNNERRSQVTNGKLD